MSTQTRARTQRKTTTRIVASIAAAMIAALAVWAVAVTVVGVELTTAQQVVGPVSIAVVALISGFGAAGLRLALRRRPPQIWLAICGTLLVLSLVGPVSAGASGLALAVLVTLHLVVGGVLLAGLAGAVDSPRAQRRPPAEPRTEHVWR